MTAGPTLDDMVRASVARGLAAIDWETRCARAERDREEARDLVRRVEANTHIRHPYPLSDDLSVAVRRWHDDEARGDDAPSPTPGSGGGPPAPAHHPQAEEVWEDDGGMRVRLLSRDSWDAEVIEPGWRGMRETGDVIDVALGRSWRRVSEGTPPAPAHHTPASDDDRVVVVLTRDEAAAMAGQLDEIARILGDDPADAAGTSLTPGELDRIATEAAARHLEGEPADVTPLEVLGLVMMARGRR